MEINFEEITIENNLNDRGGVVVIDLTTLGFKGEKMLGAQNYLGGGMLGRVVSDCTIDNWGDNDKLSQIALDLRKYVHSITNPDEECWESVTFERNQQLHVRAY
ncbi:MAG: hypothetical protein WD512_00585 [Candidatus Paceibacterota bacterium]